MMVLINRRFRRCDVSTYNNPNDSFVELALLV
jgi:hypothetical protein